MMDCLNNYESDGGSSSHGSDMSLVQQEVDADYEELTMEMSEGSGTEYDGEEQKVCKRRNSASSYSSASSTNRWDDKKNDDNSSGFSESQYTARDVHDRKYTTRDVHDRASSVASKRSDSKERERVKGHSDSHKGYRDERGRNKEEHSVEERRKDRHREDRERRYKKDEEYSRSKENKIREKDRDEKNSRRERRRSHSRRSRSHSRSLGRHHSSKSRHRTRSRSPHRKRYDDDGYKRRHSPYRKRHSPYKSSRRSRSRSRNKSPYIRHMERKTVSKLQVLEKLGIELKVPPATTAPPATTSTIPVTSTLNTALVTSSDNVQLTPQLLLQKQMEEQLEKVKAVTGVQLPSYYNPMAINPTKYAEQIQKRKLLWGNKQKTVTTTTSPTETTTTNTTSQSGTDGKGPATIWQGARFGDQDGKVTAKFKRLMGIKEEQGTSSNTDSPSSGPDLIKKQEEMFNSMESQYEVARLATHSHRGLGLGFGTFQPR